MQLRNYTLSVFLILSFIFISSCGGGLVQSGELIGVQGRFVMRSETPPFGMVLIPQGSFNMGLNDQDALYSMNANLTTVSVDAFWVDQTEVTNNEYRQFIKYVFDSVSRRTLGETNEDFLVVEDELGNTLPTPLINWKQKIDLKDPDMKESLDKMYLKKEESPSARKRFIRTDKLQYDYQWFDYQRASALKIHTLGVVTDVVADATQPQEGENEEEGAGNVVNAGGVAMEKIDNSLFVVRESVDVYPDTLVWIRDYKYAYNEPFALQYFAHPAYDDYPVVGVNWRQARAFCDWRTKMMQDYAQRTKTPEGHEYRLPTEAEWEWAARGGLDQQMYPWGGPYTFNQEGCYLANFLPLRARYSIDGGTRTLPVGSYPPNNYGLYDMAGNVSEWTNSAYSEDAYSFVNNLNPNYTYDAKQGDDISMKRKVIKGGSWKDIAYFLQNGARTFEYQDTTKSYIGFRCVRSYIGR